MGPLQGIRMEQSLGREKVEQKLSPLDFHRGN